MMVYEVTIQSVLEDIDRRIEEPIRVEELARAANYSTYHLCRVFMALTGTPVMRYVIRRKLEFARYDLSRGGRIIDVALSYGFQTHAGFTKAFKKHFGYPPSLCPLHKNLMAPGQATLHSIQNKHGGNEMTPYIIVMTPFAVAGRTLRLQRPGVKRHVDIPAFCFSEAYELGCDNLLTGTSTLFQKSDAIKHCEVSICYDVDPATGECTYLLGRGLFHPDDLANIPSDMVRVDINGLYAIFTTPPVPFEEHALAAQAIEDTWNHILTQWLPNAEFEYDEDRLDFEYFDYRDHGHYFDNKRQMDICIPIQQREEAKRRAMAKGKQLWAQEMQRREQRG